MNLSLDLGCKIRKYEEEKKESGVDAEQTGIMEAFADVYGESSFGGSQL